MVSNTTMKHIQNQNLNIKTKRMKKINDLLPVIILGAWIILVCTFIYMSETKTIEVMNNGDIRKAEIMDSLSKRSDSLYAELYPCEIELNRFQTAFKIFLKRNPMAAAEYAEIISEETE
jgi:hypothetical protein